MKNENSNQPYYPTRQRIQILQILKNTKIHPPADWVYEQARREIPHISLGTVYRNLNRLNQLGLIQRLSLGSSFDRWDGNTSPHSHLICKKCGKVWDINVPVNEDLVRQVERKTKFKVEKFKIDFHGFCSDCKAK